MTAKVMEAALAFQQAPLPGMVAGVIITLGFFYWWCRSRPEDVEEKGGDGHFEEHKGEYLNPKIRGLSRLIRISYRARYSFRSIRDQITPPLLVTAMENQGRL